MTKIHICSFLSLYLAFVKPDPLISILLPVHNAAPFLVECLESILAQTTTSWELVAIENGSTDPSYNILSDYQSQHPHIRLLRLPDKGLIPALRHGLAKSSGQLITRMDADDVMAPQKLASLKALLMEAGSGHVATGLVDYFASQGSLGQGYRSYAAWLNELSLHRTNFTQIYRECVIPSPCWMLWKEDLLLCGAFEPNTYPEDYDLCFRMYAQKLKVLACSDVLHHWRDHPARISHNDPNYLDNRFLELKVSWFLKLDHTADRPLVVWGAGKKGKLIARLLKMHKISFHWITGNLRKQNTLIYDLPLLAPTTILPVQNPQWIIAVADKNGIKEINSFAQRHQLNDLFYFC